MKTSAWMPLLLCLCVATLAAARAADESVTGPVPENLEVPARVKIAPKDSGPNALTDWCNALIKEKAKGADEEIATQTKAFQEKMKADEAKRKERERRWKMYQKYYKDDALALKPEDTTQAKPMHIRVSLLVPEISLYEQAAKVSRTKALVAQRIAAVLPNLDTNIDGSLTEVEYLRVAALLVSVFRILEPLDSNKDGMLSHGEIKSLVDIPETFEDAIKKSIGAVNGKEYRMRAFDADKDGVLDVSERKKLTMAFTEAGLEAKEDAAFYEKVTEALLTRRLAAAVKYQDVVINPE